MYTLYGLRVQILRSTDTSIAVIIILITGQRNLMLFVDQRNLLPFVGWVPPHPKAVRWRHPLAVFSRRAAVGMI